MRSIRTTCAFMGLGLAAAALAGLGASPGGAGQSGPVGVSGFDYFEKSVRPILTRNCYSCHSHAANKMRGGLALDSRSGWEKGGDSGPAVVPGQPDKSLLI